MCAPPGGLLTTSLLALAAGEGLGVPHEGADGVAEATSFDVGFAAYPGLGPSMANLISCVRSLLEVRPPGSSSLIPVERDEPKGTDLERISDGGISLPEADPPPASPTESEAAAEWRKMCRQPSARTGAPPLTHGRKSGSDSTRPSIRPATAPRSPPSSEDDATLEEYRRLCARGPRKRSISDTLASKATGDESPPGFGSEEEPEFGRGWREEALIAFPPATVPMPAQGAASSTLTEAQWRPSLESGEAPNMGWAGVFNPPPGSAGPGRSLPAYPPGEAAVFAADTHALEDIQAGFDRRASYKFPALPKRRFSSEEQRAESTKQLAIDALLPMLPDIAVSKLLDGAGAESLTREEATRAIIAGLSYKAGASGASVMEVIKTLHFLQGYADSRQRWLPSFRLWPMSAAVASTIIAGEHARATQNGRGAMGGQTCGDRLRRTLVFMSTHLGFPISTGAGMVSGAAPSQKEVKRPLGARRGAASLPMKLWIGLEWLAGLPLGTLRDEVLPRRKNGTPPSEAGVRLARHYARSLVIMQLFSIRGQEMLRARLAVEAESSEHVFAAYVSRAKDGMPGLFVARTEGFLGPIGWAQEHYGDVRNLEQFFPAFDGPHGVFTDMGLNA